MDLMGQLGDLLNQYGGGQSGQAQPVQEEVEQHFDQFAKAAPSSSLAEGLLAAFSDTQQTPPFANQAASLFGASGGDTKAQVLNTLLAVAGPMMMQKMAGGGAQGGGLESALGGLMGGGGGSMLGGLLGGGGGLAGMLGGLLGGGGASALEGMLSGKQQVTPEVAAQVPDSVVEKLAHQAAEQDPGIMGRLSEIYSNHPTLIKTLGGAALTIAMSKMADRSRQG